MRTGLVSTATTTHTTASASVSAPSTAPLTPPTEDALTSHTLWSEVEKLYGHGYEISALCSDSKGRLVVSACVAKSETVRTCDVM